MRAMCSDKNEPLVNILMGVRNGAATLPEQLSSIAAQRGVRWRLICSDDGSADDTGRVLADFAAAWPGRVQIGAGPCRGFAMNFLHMLRHLPPDPGFVALADQDDIWFTNKLSRAAGWLATVGPECPTLYCAGRVIWYPARNRHAVEMRGRVRPSFRNALIENIAPGNTIVLNPAAARLARVAARQAAGVFAHDWWLYALISGAGGLVLADPAPVLLYRQHGGNAIGTSRGLMAQARRKGEVLRGVYRARLTANMAALRRCAIHLTPTNRNTLDTFMAARGCGGAVPLFRMTNLRPYRQSHLGSAAFWGAMFFGKA